MSELGQTFDISKAQAIEGWMSDRELLWLAETASRCRHIIEIGCYKGRSTVAMLENSQAHIYCIDPMNGIYFDKNGNRVDFVKKDALECFLKNIEPYRGRVNLIQCLSEDIPIPNPDTADFVFIDGDHRYKSVVHDIKLAAWLTRKNGIIAGHDYDRADWPDVTKAVDFFYPACERVDSIWWTRK